MRHHKKEQVGILRLTSVKFQWFEQTFCLTKFKKQNQCFTFDGKFAIRLFFIKRKAFALLYQTSLNKMFDQTA